MAGPYDEFEWDEYNSGKNIKKHGVSDSEIEQVFDFPNVLFPHKKYKDRKIVLGVTNGGRYLFLAIQHISENTCRPIHARNMEKHERQIYFKMIKQGELR
jgi:hypothetical protein